MKRQKENTKIYSTQQMQGITSTSGQGKQRKEAGTIKTQKHRKKTAKLETENLDL